MDEGCITDKEYQAQEFQRAQAQIELFADILTSKASVLPMSEKYDLERHIGELCKE